jgi:hypothetical protein
VIFAGPDRSSRGARRAAAAAGSATALVWALVGVDHLLCTGFAAAPLLRDVVAASTAASVALLAPVTVRVLAHPSGSTMPARARAASVRGLSAVLGFLVIAQVAAVALQLGALAVGVLTGTTAARVLALSLTGLATLATAVAAWQLRSLRANGSAPESSAASSSLLSLGMPTAGLPTRPDLLDDLALLSARALPGSPVAWGLAWLNRGLDSWPWSPRRHTGRIAVLRPARVQPQPD